MHTIATEQMSTPLQNMCMAYFIEHLTGRVVLFFIHTLFLNLYVLESNLHYSCLDYTYMILF